MADVDITSLSVEISAESSGAEINIDKLTTAISNLRTKGNVTKVVNSLDRLSTSISTLKQASSALDGLDKLQNFLGGLGNLNVSGSVKSLNSVVNAVKKIPAAVSGLNGVDFYSMSGSITELTNALAPLSILDASGLKAIGSAVNAIGKIPDLSEKLKAADLDAFSASCQKISTALTPLASQLDKVGNAFAKLPPQLSKVVTQANRVTAANQKASKSYMSLSSQVNNFMKRAAQLVSLKALATYIGNAVVKFNDFYEATDLFNNAMGNLGDEASSLVNKMQELLGIDPKDAMEHIATIQSLATSFGLASDKAYILSKNLTQLAYDEASYWNKDSAETFTAISSAISGELEPIRRLGVDLSQARLQQELLALGFNKQVSSLSQADKAVLRYIAIMKQTTNIQGNLAQTITSPANRIRMLKAELDQLAKSVGSLLYPALSSILPPLIAAVELIKEFVQWVGKLMGVNIQFTDFSKVQSDVGGVSDAMDDTADSTKKAAKALKDYTMGFDELNIIDPTQGSSGSSGSGSGASGNILGDVDLSGYDMFKDYIGNSVDEIKAKLKSMLPLIETIAAAFATWKLVNLITDIVEAIKKMNALKSIILGLGVFSVGIVLEITGIKDAIENGVNGKNFAEIILGALIGTTGAAILGKGIAQFIVNGFGSTAVGQAIKAAGGSAAGAIIGAAVGGIVTGIPMFVTGVYDAVKNGLNTLNGTLIPLGSTMAGAGIGAIIGSLGGPIGAGVGALIGLIAGALTDVGIAIYQNWDKITAKLDDASKNLKQWFVDLGKWWNGKWDGFKTNFSTAWESLPNFVQHPIESLNQASANLKQWFVGVGEWWDEKWSGFKTNFETAWDSLPGFVQHPIESLNGASENIKNWFVGVGEWWNEKWEGFKTGFEEGWDSLPGFVQHPIESLGQAADGLKQWFSDVCDWWDEKWSSFKTGWDESWNSLVDTVKDLPKKFLNYGKNIVQGLIDGISQGWTSAKNTASGFAKVIIDKFTEIMGIHSPSKVFEQFGKFVDQGFANGIINALGYVENAMNQFAGAVQEKGKEIINSGTEAATGYVDGFFSGLDSKWNEIDSGLKNDFIGTIQTMIDAVKNGDLKAVGSTAAAIIWQAMGEKNRDAVKSYANDLIGKLSGVIKNAANTLFTESLSIGKNIWKGITNNFGDITKSVSDLGNKIYTAFSNLKGPLTKAGLGISNGLFSGLVSKFPEMLTGVAGVISTIGAAFMGMLKSIGAVLSSLGIPTGLAMLVGGTAIAVAIAAIVSSLGGTFSSSSSSSDYDASNVPGTSDYDSSHGTYSSGNYSSNSGVSASELREAVYNGCYNAFLDIYQRYNSEEKSGQTLKVYLDGKQITASVEKEQYNRGMQIMGTEAYSY